FQFSILTWTAFLYRLILHRYQWVLSLSHWLLLTAALSSLVWYLVPNSSEPAVDLYDREETDAQATNKTQPTTGHGLPPASEHFESRRFQTKQCGGYGRAMFNSGL